MKSPLSFPTCMLLLALVGCSGASDGETPDIDLSKQGDGGQDMASEAVEDMRAAATSDMGQARDASTPPMPDQGAPPQDAFFMGDAAVSGDPVDPIQGTAAPTAIPYTRQGDKLDNPFWSSARQGLVFLDGDPMLLQEAKATPLYELQDGSVSHAPKTPDLSGSLIGIRVLNRAGEEVEQVVRFDGQGGVKDVLGESYNGHKIPHFNDLAYGRDGTIYLTQRRGKPGDDYLANTKGPGALFRLSPGGTFQRIVDDSTLAGFYNPNGIALGPGGSTLYVGASDYDTKKKQGVWSFPVMADGSLGQGAFLGKTGRPDGIAVDVQGNIYVSNGEGKQVSVIDPVGKLWGTIALPEGSHTHCGFGGPEGKTFYVTTRSKLYATRVNLRGLIWSAK